MADFDKVVDKLTETNKSLAALEAQGIAAGGIKSIIAQSLPEVLNERNLAKNREKFDKKQEITEVDERVEDNTKAIITLTDEQKETIKCIHLSFEEQEDEHYRGFLFSGCKNLVVFGK